MSLPASYNKMFLEHFTKHFSIAPIKGVTMHRHSDTKYNPTYTTDSTTSPNTKLIDNKPIHLEPWSKFYDSKCTNSSNYHLAGLIAKDDFIGLDIDDLEHWNNIEPIINSIVNTTSTDTTSNTTNSSTTQVVPYITYSNPTSRGGHILFKYDPKLIGELKVIRKYLKKANIDVQIDKTLIYLANPNNTTKKYYKDINYSMPLAEQLPTPSTLPKLPTLLLNYLKAVASDQGHNTNNGNNSNTYNTTNSNNNGNTTNSANVLSKYSRDLLGFLLTEDTIITASVIQRLTPKAVYPDIRNMNDIPDGSGTDWLLGVRLKLTLDESISKEVFVRTINELNNLWDSPMAQNRVDTDINRDINSKEWVYNSKWKDIGVKYANRHNQHSMEIIFDKVQTDYLVVNRTVGDIDRYNSFTAMADVVMAETKKKLRKDEFLTVVPSVRGTNTPMQEPYIYTKNDGTMMFNSYIPSNGTEILRNPKEFAARLQDTKPYLLLQFLIHLMGESETTENQVAVNSDGTATINLVEGTNTYRLLQWMKHKFSTFEYSPLVFIFSGVSGAGKGMFLDYVLAYFAGTTSYVEATNEDLLQGHFNAYMDGASILKVDEIGEGVAESQLKKIVGYVKQVSGSPTLAIQYKGKEKIKSPNFLSFFLTTNESPKLVTLNSNHDRRNVYFDSPIKLINRLPFVVPNGDDTLSLVTTDQVLNGIKRDLDSFAYYLATEIKDISKQEYHSNEAWKGDVYKAKVTDTLSLHDKLVQALEDGDNTLLVEVFRELQPPMTNEEINNLIIYKERKGTYDLVVKCNEMEDLQDLYNHSSYSSQLKGDIMVNTKGLRKRRFIKVEGTQYNAHTIPLTNWEQLEVLNDTQLNNLLDEEN